MVLVHKSASGKAAAPEPLGLAYRRRAADRSGEARTNPAGGHFLQVPTREVPLEWACVSQAGDAPDVDEGGGRGLGLPLVLCRGWVGECLSLIFFLVDINF